MVIKYYVNCPWNLLGVVLNIFNLNSTRRALDLFMSKECAKQWLSVRQWKVLSGR